MSACRGQFSRTVKMTKHVLGVAFEMVRIAVRTEGSDDFVKQAIANKISDLARAGERNPDLLCEQVLKDIRGQECRRHTTGRPLSRVPKSEDGRE